MKLSVIIPCFNEEDAIEATFARLADVAARLTPDYELVFVDDGSSDRTALKLKAICEANANVHVLRLSRNFGHQVAVTAGLDYVSGDAVVIIDADLQDPPEVIEDFIAKWREGYHVVYGVREKRERESVLKKLTSFLFYRLMGRISDVPIPPDTGDFRLMDRRVLDIYAGLQEDPRFFRGLISWVGFRQVGIPFVRPPRAAGQTKYRYGRLLKLALDTITAFSSLPALLITITALICATASFAGASAIVCLWATGLVAVPTWGWVALGFLGLWNLQFVCIAMLGEYIVRTHKHTQRRPLYLVDTVLEHPNLVS